MITTDFRKINFYTIGNLWFLILLLSFSYDKPILILTSLDRFNPRLSDVATILGVIWYFNFNAKFNIDNVVLSAYKKLVIWFTICTVFSILIYGFPLNIDAFSIYYLFKYYQELLVCYLVLCYMSVYEIPYERIFKILIIGGVFVALYSILEYLTPGDIEVEISPGKFVTKPNGFVWGPYTATYFQIANYSPIVGFITLAYAIYKKGLYKWALIAVSFLVFWPSLVSGSRTAIGFILVLFAIAFFKDVKFRVLIIVMLSTVVVYFGFNIDALYETILSSDSETIARMQRFEESGSHNSIEGRFEYVFVWFERFPMYVYNGILVPVFGGGFYVAPMNGAFRIGYGWHNIFIFAIEQAGVIGLILFIKFIKRGYAVIGNHIKKLEINSAKRQFVFAVFVIFIAMFVLGIGGSHTFWEGFSTGNFNLFRMVLITLATYGYVNTQNKDD
ncbi:hypothetical protein [Winogradskyella thalassocola]|uniref:O-antigen ligase n=1 Tax=Winogradskyella thalassocola TaxID=262004 RepID=A0A1G7Z1B4_9FLAO|nr:hypothetical protein [Winogradskyella thalassocola]SDH02385.1 hypothetical protein SAMN04489796_1011195 [Winogradskyella thalassocola]